MADRIIDVQTITVSSTQQEIELPRLWDQTAANAGAWGPGGTGVNISGSQYYPSDRIVYVFDSFSGSFELLQEIDETEGITIYETSDKQTLSGPWRLIAGPPRFLYNSGSNSQQVKVTVVMVR